MTGHLLRRLRRWYALVRSREFLIAAAPFLLLSGAVWIKLLYIGLPQGAAVDEAWYPFNLRRALQSGVANLAALLVLLSPLWLLRPVARVVAAWVVNLALTLLVLADALHLRFFGDVISMSSTGDAWQIKMIQDSIVALLTPVDALLFVDLVLALALLPWYVRAASSLPATQRSSRMRVAIRGVAAGVVLLLLVPTPLVVVDRGNILRGGHVRFAGARKIGLLNYHVYEGARNYYRTVVSSQQVSQAERQEAVRQLTQWQDTAAGPSDMFGVARGSNLILLMVESLQAFPIGLVVEGQEVTPNLNRLAGRSMYFENFYGQTWEGTTSDGEFTSLQSLHPLPTGSVATTYPQHDFCGIPCALAEQGYRTFSAHAFYGALWNMQGMHRALGFQQSYFREHFGAGEKIGMGLGDREFLARAIPLLERSPEPFAAYLMTLSSHHPYALPARHRRLRLGAFDGTLVGKYLQTIHYLDGAVGEFVARLEADGLLDRSVLVVYGDHKAKLGPPEELERLLVRFKGFPPRAAGFDARYWREENRIPLMIHLPGDQGAGVRTASTGHLDIAPTVLDLLGVPAAAMPTLGRPLSRGKNSLVVFRNGSFALEDTLCVTPNASVATARCATVTKNVTLDPARFSSHFERARERLATSDNLLVGNLLRATIRGAPSEERRSSAARASSRAAPAAQRSAKIRSARERASGRQ